MACYHPMPAYRTYKGAVHLWKEVPDSLSLRLPCGGCLGCRTAQAKAWALRCTLELQQHDRAAFTTLTYDDEHLPATLSKRHLQLWVKRVRKTLHRARSLRFFASGEYGETNHRPHYHAILYGLDDRDRDRVHDTWGSGHTNTVNISPRAISYTAGYTSKKIGFKDAAAHDRVDYSTGEIYRWEPPFLQMSRRPGIGGEARQWVNSWRNYAVHNGQQMPVPRYLHNAWKDQATDIELEDLIYEKHQLSARKDTSTERLQAAEQIAIAKQIFQSERRKV